MPNEIINLLIGGDFCPQDRIVDIINRQQFDCAFKDIEQLNRQYDYSIINFESTVSSPNDQPIAKCGPHLQTNENAFKALDYMHFNCITLANNHINDYGSNGILNTIELAKQYHLDYVGAGSNLKEAQKILYVTVKNKCIAVVNICEHEFSIATDVNAGAAPLDSVDNYAQIIEAKQKSDFVIVIIHGGHEHFQYPSLRMKKLYRYFVDIGANVVINHHQHCYSGYENYRNAYIFYGLGNFCFDAHYRNHIWNEGYLVGLHIDRETYNFSLYPYIQCNDDAVVQLEKDVDQFNLSIKQINSIIENDELLKQKNNAFYELSDNLIRIQLSPYLNRILKALCYRKWIPTLLTKSKYISLLNMIECEAHRDKLIDYLHRQLK